MKIALFGATGQIGQVILNEALARHDEVVAVVRDPGRLTRRDPKLQIVPGDIAQPTNWLDAVRGVDAVVASLSGRRDGDPNAVPTNAGVLLENLPKIQVKRLLWVGGAGTLEVAPGVRVIDDPHFPAAWKPEADAQGKALELFRASHADLDWTYISPATLIEPGDRTGRYRMGGDQLMVDEKGQSRISIADYAVALLDRLEKGDALRQRITVAY